MITLSLSELIDFYDRKVTGSIGHATALNALLGEDLALAAFGDYLRRCRASKVEVLSKTCKKAGGGARLDAWLAVEWATTRLNSFKRRLKIGHHTPTAANQLQSPRLRQK